MARKEIVHNIRQKPPETAQGNGVTLSDGPGDSGAPSQIERVKNRAPAHGLRVTLEEYWGKWYERPQMINAPTSGSAT